MFPTVAFAEETIPGLPFPMNYLRIRFLHRGLLQGIENVQLTTDHRLNHFGA